jgi:hypothetical protein
MRLRWQRGRRLDDPGEGGDTLRHRGDPLRADQVCEWIGCDDAGEAIARVVRVPGPVIANWRRYNAVALDAEARIIELRPSLVGERWLVVVADRVVDRAPLPLAAVRRAEAALE